MQSFLFPRMSGMFDKLHRRFIMIFFYGRGIIGQISILSFFSNSGKKHITLINKVNKIDDVHVEISSSSDLRTSHSRMQLQSCRSFIPWINLTCEIFIIYSYYFHEHTAAYGEHGGGENNGKIIISRIFAENWQIFVIFFLVSDQKN